MLCGLNDLDGRIVAHLGGEVGREGHLRQTETPVVLHVAGTEDLEDWLHGEGVVRRDAPGTQVDVEESGGMAGEPAGLDPDGAAGDGP